MSASAQDRRRAVAFVVTSLVALVGVFAVIGGVRLARDERTFVVVFEESVAGLRTSSEVTYKGVPVGAVRGIRLRGGSIEEVEVEVAIDADVPIKVDTRARLQPQGITGFYGLELVGGSAAAPALPEGGVIRVVPSTIGELTAMAQDLAGVVRRAGDMLVSFEDELQRALDALHAALVAATDAARGFEATAGVIGSETRATATTLRALGEDLTATSASLRRTSDDAGALLRDPAVRALGQETVLAVRELQQVASALARAAETLAQVARENRDDVRALVRTLRETAGEARAAVREVRARPSSLVFDRPTLDKPFPDAMPELAK